MIWIDCAAIIITNVQVDDDCSILLLSNSRDMSFQDWDELMMSWRGCRFCNALTVVFRFCRCTKMIVFQICLKIRRCINLHICMKKTKIVNWLRHFELIDVMNMINDESMIVNFENIIQWFYYLEYAVRVNIEMLDQFNKWVNDEIAI
jgi:hypothetical protein